LTPPFEHLLDRYHALFDSDFIPDQLEDYQPWKPLIAKPLFLHTQINFQYQVEVFDIQVSEDGTKTVLLIRETNPLGPGRHYLMLIQENYRRGEIYKYA
jgi:hypothetical protein